MSQSRRLSTLRGPREAQRLASPDQPDGLKETLRRDNGATIEELMAEFGWLVHSGRAISIAAKRLGVAVDPC